MWLANVKQVGKIANQMKWPSTIYKLQLSLGISLIYANQNDIKLLCQSEILLPDKSMKNWRWFSIHNCSLGILAEELIVLIS